VDTIPQLRVDTTLPPKPTHLNTKCQPLVNIPNTTQTH
jgi:hypothetical protein